MGDVRIFELSFLFHRFLIRGTSATSLIFVPFRILAFEQFILFEGIFFFFSFINKEEVKVLLNLRSF